jgi:hypothetical protein
VRQPEENPRRGASRANSVAIETEDEATVLTVDRVRDPERQRMLNKPDSIDGYQSIDLLGAEVCETVSVVVLGICRDTRALC